MAEEFELKQDTKREEERRTQRGSKNVGQGMIMDLAYLLSRVSSKDRHKDAEEMEGITANGGGREEGGLLPVRAGVRRLTKEQETRVMHRIFQSMASV